MLVLVGLGRLEGVADDVAHALGEPALQATFTVSPAKTATSTVGTSAISANTQVRRRWSREPADLAFRAATARATDCSTTVATTRT